MRRSVRGAKVLIAEATEGASLDDFGGVWFRDGLEILVDCINADIDLSEEGVAIIEGSILRSLSNRLHAEGWHRSHPEIDMTPIAGPTLVTGLPRSGTTALVGMLAEDKGFRPLRQWEAAEPVPPPIAGEEDDDRRVIEARAMVDLIPPELLDLHIVDLVGPEEDHEILSTGFRSGHFGGMWPVPAYTEWWLTCDMMPAWANHERLLKLLGSRRPPADWLLKAPLHIFELENFVRQYPEAKFVMTHRDPAKTVPSVCSLMKWSYASVTDRFDPELQGPQQLAFWSEGIRRAMSARNFIGEERFIDIDHRDLVSNPMAEIERIYDFLGRELHSEAALAISSYVKRNRSDGRPNHAYSAEQFGLTPDRIRSEFAEYIDHFDLTTN